MGVGFFRDTKFLLKLILESVTVKEIFLETSFLRL